MKKTIKSVIIGTLAGIALFSVAGCSKSNSTGSGSSEKVTINFWHNYSAQSDENKILTDVLIPEFEKENPDIKVNAVSHEWQDLHDKILVSASSKTLPDVGRLDLAWIPEFESSNILVPVNKEFNDFETYSSLLLPNAMNAVKMNGNYYGLGLNINTKILFYNKELLKDKGIDSPKTMKELEEAVTKVSGKNSNGQRIWGLNEPALSGWNVLPYIWSYGGDILSADQKTSDGYINSKNSIEAVKMLKTMYSKDQLTGWSSGDIPTTDGFGASRYAMIFDGPWKIQELKDGYPNLKYGTGIMPSGKGGSHSVIGGESISLFEGSKNKKQAWKFAKFMTSDYAQKEMAKAGQIPVNKKSLESKESQDSGFAPFIEAIKSAKSRPNVSNWTEIDTMLSTTMTNIMNNKVSVEDGLNQLSKQIDKSLTKDK